MKDKQFAELMAVLERIASALEAQAYPLTTVPYPYTVTYELPTPEMPNPYWPPPQPFYRSGETGDPPPSPPTNHC